jgi:hypothetical protein
MKHAIATYLLLACFSSTQSFAAESVCEALKASLTIGTSSPKKLQDAIPGIKPAQKEEELSDVSARYPTTPSLADLAGDMTSGGHWDARVQWLVPGQIGMISVIGGTANCQIVKFFGIANQQAQTIKPPTGFSVDGEACWGDSLGARQIKDTPYLIEDQDIGKTNPHTLTIVHWQNGWGENCKITITQSVEFSVEGRSCADEVNCDALQKIAVEQAKLREKNSNQQSDNTTDTNFDKNETLPEFTENAYGGNPYTEMEDEKKFAVPGFPNMVGVIGTGHFGWRNYDGWLVSFWDSARWDSEKSWNLTSRLPYAGFQIARQNGNIEGIIINP